LPGPDEPAYCFGSPLPGAWLNKRPSAASPSRRAHRLITFLNQNAIRPVIDKVYPFEQARQTCENMVRGTFGKVVIKVS